MDVIFRRSNNSTEITLAISTCGPREIWQHREWAIQRSSPTLLTGATHTEKEEIVYRGLLGNVFGEERTSSKECWPWFLRWLVRAACWMLRSIVILPR